MAVSGRINMLIYGTAARNVTNPHLLSATVFAVAKRNARGLRKIPQVTMFTQELSSMIREGGLPFSPGKSIPPNLYDVFGFTNQSGLLMHSAVVVDIDPEIQVSNIKHPSGANIVSMYAVLGEKGALVPYRLDGDLLNARLPKSFK